MASKEMLSEFFNLLLYVLVFMHVFMFCLQKFLTYMILRTVQKTLMSVEDSDDYVVLTRKHRRICNSEALQLSLSSDCFADYHRN